MSSVKERLVAALLSMEEVHIGVLFGSTARGTSTKGSDIDIAVCLKEDSAEIRRRVEATLARAAGCEVDVVPLDTSPPQLRFEIARDGTVLLEREPHAWADFRARAMVDWWDWAPTARMIHDAAITRLREKVGRGTS